jgi:hypothetical protein
MINLFESGKQRVSINEQPHVNNTEENYTLAYYHRIINEDELPGVTDK